MLYIESGIATLKICCGNSSFRVTRKCRGDVATLKMQCHGSIMVSLHCLNIMNFDVATLFFDVATLHIQF